MPVVRLTGACGGFALIRQPLRRSAACGSLD